jgi:6-pyruvoyltetrahydropterin/6-carboxytetrahydropterin synthase
MSTKPVYKVKVCVDFSAAHHIRGYDGDCARPHGHNYKVEVEALCPELNDIGIAIDFKVLKARTKELVARFDHQDLNLIPPFNELNPTAETLARYFYDEVSKGVRLLSVTVWENDRSAVTYGVL